MRLRVGDIVVCPPHGVGRIAAVDRRLVRGTEEDVVIVELSEALTVSLPLERARAQLRPLASEAQLGLVQKTLRQAPNISDRPWLSRQNDAFAKLASGEAVDLAEIVRDSAPRSPSPTAGTKSRPSTRERDVFVKARQLLSNEISYARGIGTAEAQDWIEEQLTHA